MKLIDYADNEDSKQLERRRSLGWPNYLLSFLGAYVLFAAVCHISWPYPSPSALGLTLYSPSKIVFYYALGYFFVFLAIHLALVLPIIVVAKAIPKYRNTAVSFLLFCGLGPTWLIGLAAMYFLWYGQQAAANAFL